MSHPATYTYTDGHQSKEQNIQIAFPRLFLLLDEPDQEVEDLGVGELEADIHLGWMELTTIQ